MNYVCLECYVRPREIFYSQKLYYSLEAISTKSGAPKHITGYVRKMSRMYNTIVTPYKYFPLALLYG